MNLFSQMVIILLLATAGLSAAEQKVVFDLTTGDAGTFEKRLVRNLEGIGSYYAANKIDFKAVVVISGDAYKYFVDDLDRSPYKDDMEIVHSQKLFAKRLEMLHRAYGVEFDMCNAGMKARNIDRKVLYDYVNADHTKSVYLIKWQNAGYAYMPVQ